MKSFLVLGAVLLCHFGYDIAAAMGEGTHKESSYWFYIFRGIEGIVLCWLLLPMFTKQKDWLGTLGVFGLCVGILEEGQTVICGAMDMQNMAVPLWSGLCIEETGFMPYLALTALALTLVVKGIKRNEKH